MPPPASTWLLRGDRAIDLSTPRLMGILNATPDSFHAASRVQGEGGPAGALAMADAGAAILDVGGESTRPGAQRIDAPEQIRRVVPLIAAIRSGVTAGARAASIPVSIDTTLAAVAEAALDAGADAINDVSAGLEDPRILEVAARHGCGVVLMHRVLPPDRDSYSDRYATPPMAGDVVESVRTFLVERAQAAVAAGVDPRRIVLDPGLGFGKSVEQNVALIRGMDRLLDLGFPVLGAASRKSFIGRLSDPSRDTSPEERLPGTITVALALADRGVRLLRVHDVAEHAAALRVWAAIRTP